MESYEDSSDYHYRPYKTDTPTLGELSEILTSLDLSDAMSIEEFLNNPEEQEVYVIPDDNELIELRKQSDLHTNSNSKEADGTVLSLK